MRIKLSRRLALVPVVAAVAVGSLVAGSSPASADADPVTTGSSMLELSLPAVNKLQSLGIVAIPTKPGTVSLDPAAKHLEYTFPVVGGDASTNTLYGSLKLGGSLVIYDLQTGKRVTLNAITFTIQNDTISATPAGSKNPIILFDAVGNHDYTTTQPETFSSSDVVMHFGGAKYLDAALGTTAFSTGQNVGTFAASFTNSVDAG